MEAESVSKKKKSHQDIPMIFVFFIPCKLCFCKKKKIKCFDKAIVIWKGSIHFHKLNMSNVYITSHLYALS